MLKICLVISLVAVSNISFATEYTSFPLFRIERSKNSNQVFYTVQLDQDCVLKKKNPIEGYWIMYATHKKREKFNFFDKLVYRIVNQKTQQNTVSFELKALSKRRVHVNVKKIKNKCQVEVKTTIKNRNSALKKIFVSSVEGIMFPTVKYVDLFGEDSKGKKIKERIIP